MKTKTLAFGRINEYVATLSETDKRRAAVRRNGHGFDSDYTIKIFKSRAEMAQTIRKQETREKKWNDWSPVVKLGTSEGHKGYINGPGGLIQD